MKKISLSLFAIFFVVLLSTCKKINSNSIYIGTWVGDGKGCGDVIVITPNSYSTYSVEGNQSDCHPGKRFEGDFKVGLNHFYIGNKKFGIISKPKNIDPDTFHMKGYSVNISFPTDAVMEIRKPRFYEPHYTVKMYRKKM
jgi:hypothetical protein